MTRLRAGHGNLTSTLCITGRQLTGFCEQCQTPESVEHVLVRCREYSSYTNKGHDGRNKKVRVKINRIKGNTEVSSIRSIGQMGKI